MTSRRLIVKVFVCWAVGCCLYQVHAETDPCQNYRIDNEQWRNPAAEATSVYCDNLKPEGWYTFHLDGNPAIIPIHCMQDNICGGRVSRHIDLEGQDMPDMGKTINASLCGSYNVLGTVECCVFRQTVAIKHCDQPDIYIYYLQPPTVCPVTFCAVPAKDPVPDRKYRFFPGDKPRSLQPYAPPTPKTATTVDSLTIDGCSVVPEPCQNGSCLSLPDGGYQCLCDVGFEPIYNHTECSDVNECEGHLGVCEKGWCVNTEGSFSCACNHGYQLDLTGKNCTDTDECVEQTGACGANMTCRNIDGSFVCECPEGHISSPDGLTCEDINECRMVGLCHNGVCQNTLGSYICNCQQGYQPDLHNQYCVDTDECVEQTGVCGANMICRNIDGSFVCECPEGHISSPDGLTCEELTDVPTSNTTELVSRENFTKTASAWTTEDALQTTTEQTTNVTAATTPTPTDTTNWMSSGSVSSTSSSSQETTSSTSSLSGVLDPHIVRFVLQGKYQKSRFLYTLETQLNDTSKYSRVSADDRDAFTNASIHLDLVNATESAHNMTVVDVVFINSQTGVIIPPKLVADLINCTEFTEDLSQQVSDNMTLLAVCTSQDSCKTLQFQPQRRPALSSGSTASRLSLFDEHLPIFVAVIVVVVLCLLAYPMARLYRHCSKRGTWVPPPEQEKDEEQADDDDTDTKPTDKVNGDAPNTPEANGADGNKTEGEGGWWVVPLDQAPGAADADDDNKAKETEDTHM